MVHTELLGGGGLRRHQMYHECQSLLPILSPVEPLRLLDKGKSTQDVHSKYHGFSLM